MRAGLGMALIVALLGGCQLPPDVAPVAPALGSLPAPRAPGTGSLWHPEVGGNYPALDVRARWPGDLITVVVNESSKGSKDVLTDTKSSSSITAKVAAFFGIPATAVSFLPGGFDSSQIVDATTEHAAKGEGTTTREGALTANVTATVVAVEPNGNLHVRGHKIVSVNNEDQHLVLAGTVRSEDILRDNTVPSTRLADAHISYYGYGTVGDKERVPVIHRLFDWVWPF